MKRLDAPFPRHALHDGARKLAAICERGGARSKLDGYR